jgi:phage-related protein
MPYTIEFFNPAIKDQILAWPDGILASFTKIAEQMTHSGPNLGMPYTKAFGKGLFEIRARGPEGIGRAFFCTLVEQRIVILHGFIKKTQETPAKELKLARNRLKEMQNESP